MQQKCACSIISAEILSQLAKKGSVASKNTLLDLKRIQHKRNHSLHHLLVRPFIIGDGCRVVYDSQNGYHTRYKIARRENGILTSDNHVNEAYKLSGFVRDYFLNTFGLNSLDGYGMDIILNVNYGQRYNNALWDGEEILFGDGDMDYFRGFSKSIDVVAHELMHGITQHLANLEYHGQSGALNEHFSDVFGTIIRQKYFQQTVEEADWLIGKEVVGPLFPGKALRSVSHPGTARENDNQPSHMNHYYEGDNDNQGVHINSGIPNRAFYLASMKLGIDTTALIWFECLKRLWATANFQDMLETILDVADLLEQDKKIPSGSLLVIQEAFAQVGLKKNDLLQYEVEILNETNNFRRWLKGDLEDKDHSLFQEICSETQTIPPSLQSEDEHLLTIKLKSDEILKEYTMGESSLPQSLLKVVKLAKQKSKPLFL